MFTVSRAVYDETALRFYDNIRFHFPYHRDWWLEQTNITPQVQNMLMSIRYVEVDSADADKWFFCRSRKSLLQKLLRSNHQLKRLDTFNDSAFRLVRRLGITDLGFDASKLAIRVLLKIDSRLEPIGNESIERRLNKVGFHEGRCDGMEGVEHMQFAGTLSPQEHEFVLSQVYESTNFVKDIGAFYKSELCLELLRTENCDGGMVEHLYELRPFSQELLPKGPGDLQSWVKPSKTVRLRGRKR